LGVSQVKALTAQKTQADPPRSKHFLKAFYSVARQRLPAELVAQLEAAAQEARP
jgi:hypothetical protein